ncbi:helix-turn-helix domain-containing protein [Sphingobium sp. HT1-2]|uniref:helix-turn-helix domain-containing protein n=1 Tax=Sphingobium sp. HT1-2 TaxID=3111640 RepID=UPI003C092F32
MSWDTQAWAAKVKPGSASEKLVLIGLATCSDANHCAHPSVDWLCEFSDLNRKTVISAISRLEEKDLIRDTGRRVGRTGQVKVYRLGAGKAADPFSNSAGNGTVPKPVQSQKRNSSVFSSEESQKRDTEPVREPITPLEPKGSNPPQGGEDDGASPKKSCRGERIPANWSPPPIAELPPRAQAKARQWPSGAYEAEAEAFLSFWLAEGRAGSRKLDWNRTWFNRINEITGRVLRDARSGVQHSVPSSTPRPAQPAKAHDTSRENGAAAKIRTLVKAKLGDQQYDRWVAPSRLDIDAGTMTAVAVSSFASNYLRDNFANDLAQAMHAVLGPDAELRFANEQPPA